MDLPDEAAELFRVPPEGFIVERDALVQRLRAEGRDEDASTVKALRKPTAPRVGAEPAGDTRSRRPLRRLRGRTEPSAAQQAALAGKPSGAEDLRVATTARRDAVARARDAAVAILDERAIGAPGKRTRSPWRWRRRRPTRRRAPRWRREPSRRRPRRRGLGFGELPTMTALPGGREGTLDAPARHGASTKGTRGGADPCP